MRVEVKKYVVEWSAENWGEHTNWQPHEFHYLDNALEYVKLCVLDGDAVRMYVKSEWEDKNG